MKGSSKYRQYEGGLGRLGGIVLLIFGGYHIIYAAGLFESFGLFIPGASIRSLSLALILGGTFFFFRATKRERGNRLPWYDLILMVIALVPAFYFVFRFKVLIARFGLPTDLEVLLGTVTLVLIIEALRRTLGLLLVGLVGIFLLYGLYGNYFPGVLSVSGHSLDHVVGHLWLSELGVYGLAMSVFVNYIFIFLLLAAFLRISGAGDFFIELASSLVGRSTGGPAKVAVIASSLFGTFSGSAVANVMGTGVITIPMMKKMGFRSQTAGAVEAAASTGGQLMPPVMGAAAFVMADFLEVPYIQICLWALVPALLYYLSLFTSVHLEAARLGIQGMAKQDIPPLKEVMKEGWFYLVPLVLLVFFLGALHYTALTGCLYATLSVILLSWLSKDRDKRIGFKKIPEAIKSCSQLALELGSLFGGVGIVIGCVGLTGIALRLSSQLLNLAMGIPFLVFLYLAIICLILGMGLGTLPSYVLLAVLIGPALKKIGMDVISGHLFILYFAVVGMITPPVCFAAYAAALLAGAPPFATGFTAMRLGVVAFVVPFAFVFGSELLLMGSPGDIALALAASTLAILFITIGLNGFMRKRINWLIRCVLIIAGLTLFVPSLKLVALPVGIILIAILIIWQKGWRLNNSKRVEHKKRKHIVFH